MHAVYNRTRVSSQTREIPTMSLEHRGPVQQKNTKNYGQPKGSSSRPTSTGSTTNEVSRIVSRLTSVEKQFKEHNGDPEKSKLWTFSLAGMATQDPGGVMFPGFLVVATCQYLPKSQETTVLEVKVKGSNTNEWKVRSISGLPLALISVRDSENLGTELISIMRNQLNQNSLFSTNLVTGLARMPGVLFRVKHANDTNDINVVDASNGNVEMTFRVTLTNSTQQTYEVSVLGTNYSKSANGIANVQSEIQTYVNRMSLAHVLRRTNESFEDGNYRMMVNVLHQTPSSYTFSISSVHEEYESNPRPFRYVFQVTKHTNSDGSVFYTCPPFVNPFENNKLIQEKDFDDLFGSFFWYAKKMISQTLEHVPKEGIKDPYTRLQKRQ